MMKRTALCEQVIQLAMQGYSVGGIARQTGFSWSKVRNCVSHWRRSSKARGESLPPCICGLPCNHRDLCREKPLGGIPWQPPPADLAERAASSTIENLKKHYRVGGRTLRRWLAERGISSETRGYGRPQSPHPPRERIETLAAEGLSVRTIALEIGIGPRTVCRVVRRWREKLRSEGTALPSCKCGAPHDHSFFCSEKTYGEGTGHRARRQAPEDFEAVAPLLSINRLTRHYRTGKDVVNRWCSEFPQLPRPILTAGPKPLRPDYRATSGIGDTTYNLIERCVPSSYAPDIRADIISTIYLAVLDGSLPEERLLLDGRSVLYQFVRSHGIMYQTTVSIDEELSEDGERYIDNLADDNALDAFERIFDDD